MKGRSHVTDFEEFSTQGHRPDIGDLRRDIYELLSFFLSSQSIAELDSTDSDPLKQLGGLQRDLITKRLIAVAITIRILDDQGSQVFDMLTAYCGTITKDMTRPGEVCGLGLRDACNKVIHARKVTFDTSKAATGCTYLYPSLYLEGTEGKKAWTVDLDVVKFCRESASVLPMFL